MRAAQKQVAVRQELSPSVDAAAPLVGASVRIMQVISPAFR